jgi:hypothetical protein
MIGCSLTLLVGNAHAHHAFSAEFNADRPVLLNGKITKVEWLNPHTLLYLNVNEPAGGVTTWELELPSPNGLIHQGWSRTSLKKGDILSVSAYLARDGSHLASARRIRLADGRMLEIGTPGDGGPAK